MSSAKRRSDPTAEATVEREASEESRNRALVAWLEEYPDEADPTRPGANLSIVDRPPNVIDRPGRLNVID